ncbi:MAG: class I SAM-dependent methyltransferase [Clostridia bacterium]|nr:class I SAM-dependent methyltransferase [Clostridia bacterium]
MSPYGGLRRPEPPPEAIAGLFAGKAEANARFAPGYPPDCVRFLAESTGLTAGGTVADIGSGTGLFSRCLLDAGFRVIGVEPNDEMREESDVLLAGYRRYTSRKGTAEATGLPDGCADLVVAAQSFQWFDKPRFKEECRRILRRDGPVAILWNHRETDNDMVRGHDKLCRRLCPRYIGIEAGVKEGLTQYRRFFRNGAYVCRTFRNDYTRDWTSYLGANLASSYTPRPDEPGYDVFVRELRTLFDSLQKNGTILIPVVTLCYLGRV